MVERRRFGDLYPHLILLAGRRHRRLPGLPVLRRLDARAERHRQRPDADHAGLAVLATYYKTIFVGTSGTTREPVSRMLFNSFVMASIIAVGKIAISIISAYAVVYFRFPFRMTAFWLIFMTLMLPVEVRIYPDLQDRGRPEPARFLRRPDDPADRLGDGDAVLPPVLHDHPRRADRGLQARRRGPVPLLQGYGAAAVAHQHRRAAS